jgi:hypothetical protein
MSKLIDVSSEVHVLEQLRSSRLQALRVLDTGSEPLFDALTQGRGAGNRGSDRAGQTRRRRSMAAQVEYP